MNETKSFEVWFEQAFSFDSIYSGQKIALWKTCMKYISWYFVLNELWLCCVLRAILPERVHHWHNILSCTVQTSKHLIKKNIGQFIWILCPSFATLNIFDKLNRFVRYRHIKMRQWWNAEFHHFCTFIWWYLKNIFSLSRIFCWVKLGQSVWLFCPIFFLARCLLVLAVQDKMLRQWWTRSGRIALMLSGYVNKCVNSWCLERYLPYW